MAVIALARGSRVKGRYAKILRVQTDRTARSRPALLGSKAAETLEPSWVE